MTPTFITFYIDFKIYSDSMDFMKFNELAEKIDVWVRQHENGAAKLSVGADVSVGLVDKIRRGHIPKQSSIAKICAFLGLDPNEYVIHKDP